MIEKILDKKNLVHLGAIAFFALVTLLYCFPVLQGKVLVQNDIVKHKALSHEIREFRAEHGTEPLWTTKVFSGMTTFNISTNFATNVMKYMDSVIREWLPRTVNIMFITCLGAYVLLLVAGVNPWLAMIAAAGYALSSNLLVSLMAGHNTKVISFAYMAPALGGVFLAYSNRHFLGAALTALAVGLMVTAGHYQVTYYFLLSGLVIGVIELVLAIKHQTLPHFAKATAILIAAGAIGVFPNFSKLYNVYEHSKHTIRGGDSELDLKDEQDKGGLDRSYAFSWSYGILESFTTVVPSFMGGATGEALPKDGEVAEALEKFNVSRKQKEQILAQAPLYMGEQPFIQGTVYFGAAFIFLFILGLMLANHRIRTWAIGLTVLSFFIAWGKHFPVLSNFLFDYFPLYNKFRTPSMALGIAGMIMPVLGVFALNKALNGDIDPAVFKKKLKLTLYIAGGIMAFLLLYGITNDWVGAKDAQYQTENSPWAIDELYEALLADRQANYMADWFLSTAIMAIAAGLIWFYRKGRIRMQLVLGIFALIIIGDLWRVSKRYLNNDAFVNERQYEAQFIPTQADLVLLNDNELNFRMVNLTRNPWTDGHSSYHHRNVGGHHAAKLQRYQDLITKQLTPQLQMMQRGIRQADKQLILDPSVGTRLTAFNMLNTKYFIAKNNTPAGAVRNPHACGPAWFVEDLHKASSANEEMEAIGTIDPNRTAVVHEEFSEELFDYDFGKPENATIELTFFQPNELRYTTNSPEDGLAVFSEIYYENGWNATIDGEPADIYRANYVLRAMRIPAGKHEVVMRFEPKSYKTGERVSLAGSALFVLFFGGMLFAYSRKRGRQSNAES